MICIQWFIFLEGNEKKINSSCSSWVNIKCINWSFDLNLWVLPCFISLLQNQNHFRMQKITISSLVCCYLVTLAFISLFFYHEYWSIWSIQKVDLPTYSLSKMFKMAKSTPLKDYWELISKHAITLYVKSIYISRSLGIRI